MSWLDIILDLIMGQNKRVIPKIMPSMTSDYVGDLLRKYTDKIWLSDGTFQLVDTQNLKDFLASDSINKRPYIAEKHDCDDYSYELMGHVSDWNPDNTFGIVWGLNSDGGGHAWNFFISEKKKIMFVEPQSDAIFEPTTEQIWIMIV